MCDTFYIYVRYCDDYIYYIHFICQKNIIVRYLFSIQSNKRQTFCKQFFIRIFFKNFKFYHFYQFFKNTIVLINIE